MNIVQATQPDFLSSVLMALPECVYWKDLQSVYIGCNKTMLKMAGAKELNEVIGKTDYDMPWHGSAEDLRSNDQKVITSKETCIFQEIATTNDGTFMIMRSKKSPLYNVQGEVIGVIGVSVNITDFVFDQKQQKEQITALKNFFDNQINDLITHCYELTGQKLPANSSINDIMAQIRSFLQNIISLLPGNLFWKNKQGVYLGCNNQLLKIFKFNSVQEFIGKTAHDILDKGMADEVVNVDNQVMQHNKSVIIEELGYNANGEYATYLSYKSPWRDPNGKTIGMIGLALDISERKKIEKDLMKAKEIAENAMTAKNQFLGNMRHDIRTPLTSIVGVAKILQAQETDNEKKKLITGLVDAGSTLLELLTKMLEFADVGLGERPLSHESFNLKSIIEKTVQLCFIGKEDSPVSLIVDIDDKMPESLIGDAFRVQRILLNLFSNAIKFTHKGSITLSAKLISKKLNSMRVEISVIDTGIGISPEKHEYIFGKFNTLHNGPYKGEGLGLAIVKQFTEELQGEIFLESELGKGSAFTCSLPFEYKR